MRDALKAVVVMLALAGTACATDGVARAPVKDEFTMPDGTRVVCRMEKPTGSNLRERVCRKVDGNKDATLQAAEVGTNRQQAPVQNAGTR